MSSDEKINRQINTALEYRKQQDELIKQCDPNTNGFVTREMKAKAPKIDSLQSAKMQIRAMRRSTMKRQKTVIDFQEMIEKTKHEEIDEKDVIKEDSLSSEDSESSTEVIDGQVVK